MTVVVVSGIYGLNASQRRRKARLLHQRTKKQLDILDDEDAFWNEERIKKEVRRMERVFKSGSGCDGWCVLWIKRNIYRR